MSVVFEIYFATADEEKVVVSYFDSINGFRHNYFVSKKSLDLSIFKCNGIKFFFLLITKNRYVII